MSSVILSLLFCSGCSRSKPTTLLIATAANMQFVMPELVKQFKQLSGIDCDITVSSSGKLTSQIVAGAPFDVFVSADLKYPQALYAQGMTQAEPKVYAYGTLVMWSMKSEIKPSLETLKNPSLRFVAIANPKFAPYGQAAQESLETLNLLPQLESKLVFGESIAQVNQFVISQTVDMGFTSKSVVLSSEINQGQWQEIDSSLHQPIRQGIALIKSERLQLAQQFQDFLFSPKGQNILQRYGYDPV